MPLKYNRQLNEVALFIRQVTLSTSGAMIVDHPPGPIGGLYVLDLATKQFTLIPLDNVEKIAPKIVRYSEVL